VQPVAAATARTGDINIVQTGLGTATALRTVTVRPRVDGLLKSVEFAEGQLVKAGDTIAQIDPVPFQVALSQVEGQLARDAAQLNNARLDYERYKKLLEQDSIAAQQVDAQAAMEMAPQVAHILAAELGHDEAWEQQQVSGFRNLALHYLFK